ncbi:MAG: bifunctional phosphoribosylaminoimidazolecarboxamide formyltransferase/IMP cyclohydrolase [Bdellovibrionaceae bacterium]|nr:bifunctional phosphoribosylaminoimidazolecarboxamide formyltransferase/IMP cyclohydrolase [Pseudobdellovibrionaceae bacterium]
MFRRILASVSNKDGLVDFLKPFVEQGASVVSSGGTAGLLAKAGLPVTEVSDYTGFPECLGGRVKTLHPKVHMGLLFRADNESDADTLAQFEVQPFDLVIVNLYPYAEAQAQGLDDKELIEYIDIGGPAMLRASAKNYENVCVVCDPADYRWIAEKNGELSLDDRRYLAAKVFRMTSTYDQMIAKDLYKNLASLNENSMPLMMQGELISSLRYGENPHQKAWWYSLESKGLHGAKILQGKPLSFNNILDLQAACTTVRSFSVPTAVVVKHNNSCGVASSENPTEALAKALKADPVSVFGGIVATNFPLTAEHVALMKDIFLECVLVPEVMDDVVEELGKKKNLRVLVWPELSDYSPSVDVRSVDGGMLVQEVDTVGDLSSGCQFIGATPTPAELEDLVFAWRVCASLKSNAISVCKNQQTLGLGMGQVNRVDAVKHALQRAKDFHGGVDGLVLASDAFFPFPDSIDIAAQSGVRWIVQPGGSIKDDEVIAAAKRHNINMVITGKRHFRH